MSFNILGYFLGINYASIYGILIVGFIKGEVQLSRAIFSRKKGLMV